MNNNATIWIPGSKSQTIRALLIAAFAKGISTIKNPLISSDTLSCIEAVKAMGAEVEIDEENDIAYVTSDGFSGKEEVFINKEIR